MKVLARIIKTKQIKNYLILLKRMRFFVLLDLIDMLKL